MITDQKKLVGYSAMTTNVLPSNGLRDLQRHGFYSDKIRRYRTFNIKSYWRSIGCCLHFFRFCSKLKWSGKFNNAGNFPGRPLLTFLTFTYSLNQGFGGYFGIFSGNNIIPWLEKSLWYFCNGKKLIKK